MIIFLNMINIVCFICYNYESHKHLDLLAKRWAHGLSALSIALILLYFFL